MKIVKSRAFWVALITALLAAIAVTVFCVAVMGDEAAVIERRKSELIFFAVMLCLTAVGVGGYSLCRYIKFKRRGRQ